MDKPHRPRSDKIHTSVGTITLDGSILTFTDGMEGVFENAGFEVVSRQRRLQGVFELIGLFNSVPTFDRWNTSIRPMTYRRRFP